MKLSARTATVSAILALGAAPAIAAGPPAGVPSAGDNPGTSYQQEHRPSETPTAESNPGTARRVAAPGQYCKNASKERVEGQKGTAFSACVKGQARLRKGKADSPREACKGASKQRVDGEKGTPFSACVKAAARLLRDQRQQPGQETADSTPTA